jgi:hypothetical protein
VSRTTASGDTSRTAALADERRMPATDIRHTQACQDSNVQVRPSMRVYGHCSLCVRSVEEGSKRQSAPPPCKSTCAISPETHLARVHLTRAHFNRLTKTAEEPSPLRFGPTAPGTYRLDHPCHGFAREACARLARYAEPCCHPPTTRQPDAGGPNPGTRSGSAGLVRPRPATMTAGRLAQAPGLA